MPRIDTLFRPFRAINLSLITTRGDAPGWYVGPLRGGKQLRTRNKVALSNLRDKGVASLDPASFIEVTKVEP